MTTHQSNKSPANFSLEKFISRAFSETGNIEITAEVSKDKKYYYLLPFGAPPGTTYSIPKSGVSKITPLSSATHSRTVAGELFSVTVHRETICLSISVLTAGEIFRERSADSIFARTNATKNASINFRNSGEGTLSYADHTVNCLAAC
jgi:hypothetical protein